MATDFPASLDAFTNPAASDPQNAPSHSAQHANANDAIEALEAKVGADSSAVVTSHDYKIAQLESGKSDVGHGHDDRYYTESEIDTLLAGYSTAGHVHPASSITSGEFADALISESSVTQHQAAITITESQISDLSHYTDEMVDDRVNTLFTDGEGITSSYDDDANTLTVSVDINGLTADGSPDGAADYVMTYDASATGLKKVLLDDLPGGGTPGGSNTEIQFNSSGSFGASSKLTWNNGLNIALTSGTSGIKVEAGTTAATQLELVGRTNGGQPSDPMVKIINAAGGATVTDVIQVRNSADSDTVFNVRGDGAVTMDSLTVEGSSITSFGGGVSTNNLTVAGGGSSDTTATFTSRNNGGMTNPILLLEEGNALFSGDYIQAKNVSGDVLFSVGDDGNTNAALFAEARDSTSTPVTVKAAASQSANLQEWQDSSENSLTAIGADCGLDFYDTSSNKQVDINWASNFLTLETFLSTGIYLKSRDNVYIQAGPARSISFLSSGGSIFMSVNSTQGFLALDHQGVDFTGRSDNSGDKYGINLNNDTVVGSMQSNSAAVVVSTGSRSGEVGSEVHAQIGTPNEAALFTPVATTHKGLTVKAIASQSASLQEWQNSSGTVLSEVDETGKFETTTDIEVTGSANGLILESPDATRWRVTVDNSGNLSTASV